MSTTSNSYDFDGLMKKLDNGDFDKKIKFMADSLVGKNVHKKESPPPIIDPFILIHQVVDDIRRNPHMISDTTTIVITSERELFFTFKGALLSVTKRDDIDVITHFNPDITIDMIKAENAIEIIRDKSNYACYSSSCPSAPTSFRTSVNSLWHLISTMRSGSVDNRTG
jgi:hypothetical protein